MKISIIDYRKITVYIIIILLKCLWMYSAKRNCHREKYHVINYIIQTEEFKII